MKSAFFSIIMCIGASTFALAAPSTIKLTRPDDLESPIEIEGLGDSKFLLFTADGPENRPPMLGDLTTREGVTRFQPRFPLEPGSRYMAQLNHADSQTIFLFETPKRVRVGDPARAVRVAPSANLLPENLLKFYIEFSRPMSRGDSYEHIHLLDAMGKPVDLPFLELGEELWDTRGMRFTLLFDPGRIKTGLRPRLEAGPVLEAGKSYTLVIDKGWLDAEGDPLEREFRKPFRVGPMDRQSPDPKTWKVARPVAGTASPLVVTFPEPLDRAMLGRVLGVVAPNGKPLPGAVEVGNDETSWSFRPDLAWMPGNYTIRIDTKLEDLCGNSIAKPFEVDIFDRVDRTNQSETVNLPFTVQPARGQ